jgi:hypothetical protein
MDGPPPDSKHSGGLRSSKRRRVFLLVVVLAVVIGLVASSLAALALELPWPSTTTISSCAPDCPTCAGYIFGLLSPNDESFLPTNASRGSTYWYSFSFVHCGGGSFEVESLSFITLSANSSMISGVATYSLLSQNQALISSENASTGVWGGGQAATVPVQGFLSVASTTSLRGDQIEALVDHCEECAADFSSPSAGSP